MPDERQPMSAAMISLGAGEGRIQSVITGGLTDVTGAAGDGARFVVGFTAAHDFFGR